jgi:hypothetical protein
MPSKPDWKKEAEKKYKSEQEDLNRDVKSGFTLHLFLLAVIAVVFGAVYVVKWLIVGGDFLPSNRDAIWAIAVVGGGIPFTYVMERLDRKREVREQRLIRLEMKIDTLLGKHEHVDSQLTDLRHEIWQSRSR